MHLENLYLVVCFGALLLRSEEAATDVLTSERPQDMESKERENDTAPNSKNLNVKEDLLILEDRKKNFSSDLNSKKDVLISEDRRRTFSRWNYSRMFPETTTFDDWWYLTTRRPIFYKDFPGRPGVATWWEINPVKRVSRKMKNPTAESVPSEAWTLKAPVRWTIILLKTFFVVFIFLIF